MIPTSQPNKAQRDWRELLRNHGSAISGFDLPEPIVAHHVCGRTAKHNRVEIGHWWVLPLADSEHKLLHSYMSVLELNALGFNPVGRWDLEKFLFFKVLKEVGGESIVPDDVLIAIAEYHR